MTTTETAPAPPRLPLPARVALTPIAMLAAPGIALVAVLLPAGTGQIVVSHLCATVAGLGLAIALVRGVDRRPVAALAMGRPALPACLAALAVTAACIAAGTVVAAALGLTAPTPQMPAPALAAMLTSLTQSFLLQAIPEEVLFRGYLVQTALGRLPLWGVSALSVLVFTVPHLLSRSGATTPAQTVLFLLLPLGFALLATAFRLRTGSVWPAVAVHGSFHVSLSVASLWALPRPELYGAYLAVVGGILVIAGLLATGVTVTRQERPGTTAAAGDTQQERPGTTAAAAGNTQQGQPDAAPAGPPQAPIGGDACPK